MVIFIIKVGGYYNDDYEYIPGAGWDDYNKCYPTEEDDADCYEDLGKFCNIHFKMGMSMMDMVILMMRIYLKKKILF